MYIQVLQDAIGQKRVNDRKCIVRMAELQARIGLSRSIIYQLTKSGQFPTSIPRGERAIGWLESRIKSSLPDAK